MCVCVCVCVWCEGGVGGGGVFVCLFVVDVVFSKIYGQHCFKKF